jgi:hypothetical protein
MYGGTSKPEGVGVEDSPATETPAAEIDVSRPHTARMYDYYLGGKNHFAADRELADKVLVSMPSARTAARENRAFMARAVRFLAGEVGIRQFLDIGTGLPTTNSLLAPGGRGALRIWCGGAGGRLARVRAAAWRGLRPAGKMGAGCP